MKLSFKGGCGEVGRSALLLNGEILLDYGLKPGEFSEYPLPGGADPKAVLISHGHLDHCGAVPKLMAAEPEVYMTPPTAALAELLAKDTLKLAASTLSGVGPFEPAALAELSQKTQKKAFRESFRVLGYKACFYRAGHIPGAASIYLESKSGETLLYTGDLSLKPTRLVEGAEEFPEAKTLVIESTYFGEEHKPREETERAFIKSIWETLDKGGSAIIPAFAIGRTQEILMLLDAQGISAYVDGLGRKVSSLFMQYPEYLRDEKALQKALGRAVSVKEPRRRALFKEPAVIVTTAGMLNGGPVLYYLNKLHKDPNSKVLLTGYQVKGTNGRMALENKLIEDRGTVLTLKPKVEQYDFSAHCGDKALKAFVRECSDKGTERVFVMHGEKPGEFAEWIREEIGIKAYAPLNGETFLV
ncbi:MAG: MBL fold metallo-hydrolase [Methanosarcinaceae archaeon]|nr:MBL fold metallo-hydrolase [Methanosarcinaceae archaeon]